MINQKILVFEYVENHFHLTAGFFVVLPDRFYGDFGCRLVGEHEHAGGNAAEGHGAAFVFSGQRQAGTVAGGEEVAMALGQRAIDDGADGVQDVFCG